MDRAAKKELVTTLNGVFKGTTVVVVAQNSGLTVAQMQTLRRQMKQVGATVKVTKNRLAKIALDGTDAAVVVPLLKGPTEATSVPSRAILARRFLATFTAAPACRICLRRVCIWATLRPEY